METNHRFPTPQEGENNNIQIKISSSSAVTGVKEFLLSQFSPSRMSTPSAKPFLEPAVIAAPATPTATATATYPLRLKPPPTRMPKTRASSTYINPEETNDELFERLRRRRKKLDSGECNHTKNHGSVNSSISSYNSHVSNHANQPKAHEEKAREEQGLEIDYYGVGKGAQNIETISSKHNEMISRMEARHGQFPLNYSKKSTNAFFGKRNDGYEISRMGSEGIAEQKVSRASVRRDVSLFSSSCSVSSVESSVKVERKSGKSLRTADERSFGNNVCKSSSKLSQQAFSFEESHTGASTSGHSCDENVSITSSICDSSERKSDNSNSAVDEYRVGHHVHKSSGKLSQQAFSFEESHTGASASGHSCDESASITSSICDSSESKSDNSNSVIDEYRIGRRIHKSSGKSLQQAFSFMESRTGASTSSRYCDKSVSVTSSICESSVGTSVKHISAKDSDETEEVANIIKIKKSHNDWGVGSERNGSWERFSGSSGQGKMPGIAIPRTQVAKSRAFTSPSSELTPKKNNNSHALVRKVAIDHSGGRITKVVGDNSKQLSTSNDSGDWSTSSRIVDWDAEKTSLYSKGMFGAIDNTKISKWTSTAQCANKEPEVYISTSESMVTASTMDLTERPSTIGASSSYLSSFDNSSFSKGFDEFKFKKDSDHTSTLQVASDEDFHRFEEEISTPKLMMQINKMVNQSVSGNETDHNSIDQSGYDESHFRSEEEISTPKLMMKCNMVQNGSISLRQMGSGDDSDFRGILTTPKLMNKAEQLFSAMGETSAGFRHLSSSDTSSANESIFNQITEEFNNLSVGIPGKSQILEKTDEGKQLNKFFLQQSFPSETQSARKFGSRSGSSSDILLIGSRGADDASLSSESIERATSNAYFSRLLKKHGSDVSMYKAPHEEESVLFTNPNTVPRREKSRRTESVSLSHHLFSSSSSQLGVNDAGSNVYSVQKILSDRSTASIHQSSVSKMRPSHNILEPSEYTNSDMNESTFHQRYVYTNRTAAGVKRGEFCFDILASTSEDDSLSTLSRSTFCSASVSSNSKEIQSYIDSVVQKLVKEKMQISGSAKEDIGMAIQSKAQLEARVKKLMKKSEEQSKQLQKARRAKKIAKEEISREMEVALARKASEMKSCIEVALKQAEESKCRAENEISCLRLQLDSACGNDSKANRCRQNALDFDRNHKVLHQNSQHDQNRASIVKGEIEDSFVNAVNEFEAWSDQQLHLIDSLLSNQSNVENEEKIRILKSSMESAMNGMAELQSRIQLRHKYSGDK